MANFTNFANAAAGQQIQVFGAAPGPTFKGADLSTSADTKTAVNQFCQRHCRRPISKEDIVYTTQKFASGYQATIKLNCINGQEFAGEICQNAKDAEKKAAGQVIDHFSAEIAALAVGGNGTKSGQQKKKRKADGEAGGAPKAAKMVMDPATQAALAASTPTDKSSKGELNAHFSKIVRKNTGKGEIVYESNMVEGGGYQSMVRLPGLPDFWGEQIWAGELCAKKVDAEQSAAAQALAAIQGDANLMALYRQPPKPKNWPPAGGKGGGKGGGFRPQGGPPATVVPPRPVSQNDAAAIMAAQYNYAALASFYPGLQTGFHN